jgi:hypothetical protein
MKQVAALLQERSGLLNLTKVSAEELQQNKIPTPHGYVRSAAMLCKGFHSETGNSAPATSAPGLAAESSGTERGVQIVRGIGLVKECDRGCLLEKLADLVLGAATGDDNGK